MQLGFVFTRAGEGYLKGLRGSIQRDPQRVRSAGEVLEPITLRWDGERLVAKMRGNLTALLDTNEALYKRGAGRGIWELVTWRPIPFVVTA